MSDSCQRLWDATEKSGGIMIFQPAIPSFPSSGDSNLLSSGAICKGAWPFASLLFSTKVQILISGVKASF